MPRDPDPSKFRTLSVDSRVKAEIERLSALTRWRQNEVVREAVERLAQSLGVAGQIERR